MRRGLRSESVGHFTACVPSVRTISAVFMAFSGCSKATDPREIYTTAAGPLPPNRRIDVRMSKRRPFLVRREQPVNLPPVSRSQLSAHPERLPPPTSLPNPAAMVQAPFAGVERGGCLPPIRRLQAFAGQVAKGSV